MKAYTKEFTQAYKVCALWSSTNDNGSNLDDTHNVDDIDTATSDTMDRDCEAFVRENWADLKDLDPTQCGHDFWLTRNGHGAGFWDRGLEEVGERLSAACGWHTPFPEVDLYIGDDNKVHA